MNKEQAIKDVCLIARNAIERIGELEGKRKREWVGLTHREFVTATDGLEDLEDCWTAIEAKLKEKNGG